MEKGHGSRFVNEGVFGFKIFHQRFNDITCTKFFAVVAPDATSEKRFVTLQAIM
jgi:hypothetical protein